MVQKSKVIIIMLFKISGNHPQKRLRKTFEEQGRACYI